MTSEQIKNLAASWIAEALWTETEEKLSPAYSQLDDLLFDDPENGWLVIQEIATKEISEEVMAVFAAGPVENLLSRHGPLFIDQIEEKAQNDPKFNFVLGGVWQNLMTDEIWKRIKKIRKQTW